MSSRSNPKPSREVVVISQRPNEPLTAAATSTPFSSVSQALAVESVLSAPASARQTSSVFSNGMKNILEDLRELDQCLQGVP